MTDEVTINSSASQQLGIAQPNDISQGHALLGETLLAARIAKKFTQQDVSNSLRLSIKQIEALESNDFAALPESMITRGFIRNYARFLDVEAAPLLASYRERVPDALPSALSVQSSTYQVMAGKDSQPWLKYILGSILVLLFLLAWFFYMNYVPKPANLPTEKMPVAIVTNTLPTEVPLPEIALPAAERQVGNSDAVASADVTISANADISNITPANTTPAATVSSIAGANLALPIKSTKENMPAASINSKLPPTAALATQVQVAPDGKATIKVEPIVRVEVKANDTAAATKKVSMSFSEQTWVSVTNKAGKVIFEKMLAAGSTDGFDGEPPFNVVIGNAKATKLTFLGKPVDLVSSTKSNVARLTLE